MPRYDYKCKKCGAHEIIAHGFDFEGQHDCFMDSCDGVMSKQIPITPAIFKATGFYKTGG